MRKWLEKMCGLRAARKGQTTAEYAIIVALIAVSSIAIILIFGDQIRALFSSETQQLGGDEGATTEVQDVEDEDVEGGLRDF